MDTFILIITLIILIISLIWINNYWSYCRKYTKFPQYKGHVILGNLEFFTGKLFEKHTTPFYTRIFNAYNSILTEEVRKKDVFLFWLAFVPYVIMTNAKAVEKMLTSTKLIEKSSDYNLVKPWLSTGLLTSGSDKWKSRRKLLTPAFHFRILNDFIPIINKHAKILVSKLKERINQPLNIVRYVEMEALDVICETAMGVSIEAQSDHNCEYARAVINASDAIFARIFKFIHWIDFIYYRTESGRKFKQTVEYLHNFTDNVIETRKKAMIEAEEGKHKDGKKKDDSLYFGKKKQATAFMDLLIKRHLEGLKPDGTSDFTLKDIREEVDTFMFEGFDTTSAALTWTLHLLGHNEDIQEKAYEEVYGIFGDDTEREITDTDLHDLKYVELCIKEALRIYPSVPLFARKVTEDIEICGYTIPRNATIVIYTHGLHRDPEVFPEPEKFIPERFLPEESLNRHPFAYIPFSAGPRNCIGQKFAMMELKLTIAEILRNFKVKSLNKDIALSIDLILKAREDVLIKFSPRTSH